MGMAFLAENYGNGSEGTTNIAYSSSFESRVRAVKHEHPEYATWNDVSHLQEQITVLQGDLQDMLDLIGRLRDSMAPPPHPLDLDKDDPSLATRCERHAQGQHVDPWAHHNVCPLCWDALHGHHDTKEGGDHGNESDSDPRTR